MGCFELLDFESPMYGAENERRFISERKIISNFYNLPEGMKLALFGIKRVPDTDFAILHLQKETNLAKRKFDFLNFQTMTSVFSLDIQTPNAPHYNFPKKDEVEIIYLPDKSTKHVCISLIISGDKITETSRKDVDFDSGEDNKPDINALLGNNKTKSQIGFKKKLSDGNYIEVKLSDQPQSLEKFLVLSDKNGKEIKNVEIINKNDKIMVDNYQGYSYEFMCNNDKYIVLTSNLNNSYSQSLCKEIFIYSYPELVKKCVVPCHNVLNREIGYTAVKCLVADNDKVIVGLATEINIVDIPSGKIEKSFMLSKNTPIEKHYKLSADTYLTILRDSRTYIWKLDGTIVAKRKSRERGFLISYIVLDAKRVLVENDNKVFIEALND